MSDDFTFNDTLESYDTTATSIPEMESLFNRGVAEGLVVTITRPTFFGEAEKVHVLRGIPQILSHTPMMWHIGSLGEVAIEAFNVRGPGPRSVTLHDTAEAKATTPKEMNALLRWAEKNGRKAALDGVNATLRVFDTWKWDGKYWVGDSAGRVVGIRDCLGDGVSIRGAEAVAALKAIQETEVDILLAKHETEVGEPSCNLCKDTGFIPFETDTDDFDVLCHHCTARTNTGLSDSPSSPKKWTLSLLVTDDITGWEARRGNEVIEFRTSFFTKMGCYIAGVWEPTRICTFVNFIPSWESWEAVSNEHSHEMAAARVLAMLNNEKETHRPSFPIVGLKSHTDPSRRST